MKRDARCVLWAFHKGKHDYNPRHADYDETMVPVGVEGKPWIVCEKRPRCTRLRIPIVYGNRPGVPWE